jgi:DNA-binding GntR family transcriptional regulator
MEVNRGRTGWWPVRRQQGPGGDLTEFADGRRAGGQRSMDPMGSPDVPDGACHSSVTQPHDAAELRTLIEVAALRRLADRGLTDEELATSRRLARATVRSARGGDLPGYLEADAAFHLYLLGLTSNPVQAEVARLLLGNRAGHRPGGERAQRMETGAGEHGEILALLADDRVGAASEMLRQHVAAGLPDPGER